MDFKISRRENQVPFSQISDTQQNLEKVRNNKEPFLFTQIGVEGGNLIPCNTEKKIPYSQIANIQGFWERDGLAPVNNVEQESYNKSFEKKIVIVENSGDQPITYGQALRNNLWSNLRH